jgi:hypothetical protein
MVASIIKPKSMIAILTLISQSYSQGPGSLAGPKITKMTTYDSRSIEFAKSIKVGSWPPQSLSVEIWRIPLTNNRSSAQTLDCRLVLNQALIFFFCTCGSKGNTCSSGVTFPYTISHRSRRGSGVSQAFSGSRSQSRSKCRLQPLVYHNFIG